MAWISFDRFDDDPAILLASLASAYARVDSGCADLVADMGGLGMSLLGRAVLRLVSALREVDDILIHRAALGTLIDEVDEYRRVLASSAAVGAAGMSSLTPAELRLLPYLQTHLTASKIAERLFVSSHTVKTETKSIYRKLGASSRDDAVQKATPSAYSAHSREICHCGGEGATTCTSITSSRRLVIRCTSPARAA